MCQKRLPSLEVKDCLVDILGPALSISPDDVLERRVLVNVELVRPGVEDINGLRDKSGIVLRVIYGIITTLGKNLHRNNWNEMKV